jgi:hypothetical protein
MGGGINEFEPPQGYTTLDECFLVLGCEKAGCTYLCVLKRFLDFYKLIAAFVLRTIDLVLKSKIALDQVLLCCVFLLENNCLMRFFYFNFSAWQLSRHNLLLVSNGHHWCLTEFHWKNDCNRLFLCYGSFSLHAPRIRWILYFPRLPSGLAADSTG